MKDGVWMPITQAAARATQAVALAVCVVFAAFQVSVGIQSFATLKLSSLIVNLGLCVVAPLIIAVHTIAANVTLQSAPAAGERSARMIGSFFKGCVLAAVIVGIGGRLMFCLVPYLGGEAVDVSAILLRTRTSYEIFGRDRLNLSCTRFAELQLGGSERVSDVCLAKKDRILVQQSVEMSTPACVIVTARSNFLGWYAQSIRQATCN